MMQPMRFKKSLFGFSKEQVVEYIAQMDRLAEQQRQELVRNYSAQVEHAQRENEVLRGQCEQYRAEVEQSTALADRLQQQVSLLSQQVEAGDLLRQRLEETTAEREEWINKYTALEGDMDRASREALEREQRLSDFIDRVQEKNVELLQKQVAMEIRLSSAERELCSRAPRQSEVAEPSPVETANQTAKEEIIAALDSILTKLDAMSAPEDDLSGGRLYRLADQN